MSEHNAALEVDGLRRVAEHVHHVQTNMSTAVQNLLQRSVMHDVSKYSPDERLLLCAKPVLDSLVYDSEEYKRHLRQIDQSVQAHYRMNSHHPEHHENGFHDMSLFDLLEMLCDWKAAADAKGEGYFPQIFMENCNKRDTPAVIVELLLNTISELEWEDL